MSKSTHFIGQPLLGQLLSFIDQTDVRRISKKHGGERYVKHFDAWHHLVTMLYAIIMRFDSLREIQTSMAAESRKLFHQKRFLGRYTPPCTINTKKFFHRTAETEWVLPVGLGN